MIEKSQLQNERGREDAQNGLYAFTRADSGLWSDTKRMCLPDCDFVFRQDEIDKLSDLLGIEAAQIGLYFFSPKVEKHQHANV